MALSSLCSLAKRGIEVSSVVIFVIHSFFLETVVSVCCEEKSSTKSIRAFVKPTVQKDFRLIARILLEPE